MKALIIDADTLPITLPDHQNAQLDRLMGSLEKRAGIKNIKINEQSSSPFSLCIYFEEKIISKSQIQYILDKTAKKLDDTFGHLWIKIKTLPDNARVQALEMILENFKGVVQVLVVPVGLVFLEFNKYMIQESVLTELIEKMDLVI